MIVTLQIDTAKRDEVVRAIQVLEPFSLPETPAVQDEKPIDGRRVSLAQTLEHVERQFILQALRMTNYNRAESARILGMPERTLYRRLEHFGLAIIERRQKTETK